MASKTASLTGTGTISGETSKLNVISSIVRTRSLTRISRQRIRPLPTLAIDHRKLQFVAWKRGGIRHGGEIFLEILATSGGGLAAQIVHCEHHGQFLARSAGEE